MKKLLFLSACLWVLAGPAWAQTTPANVVVVRIFEGNGGVTAVVSRGEGQSTKAQFALGNSERGLAQAGEGYQKLLALLYQEGYVLQTSFSTTQPAAARQAATSYVTLILAKKQ